MASHAERKKRIHRPKGAEQQRVSDLGPYVAFILIWLFAYGVFYLTLPDYAAQLSLGLILALFLYVTLVTGRAYLGQRLYQWQKGLVRLPLMLAGGARTPVAEMKGTGTGRLAVLMSVILLLLSVGLLLWVLR